MIGQIIWVFDYNRRVYRKDEAGRYSGPPIYREHWRPCEVVGETRVSWMLRGGEKVPKRGRQGAAFTQEEVDQDVYVHDNRRAVSELVQRLDYEDLKRVADLIGYVPKEDV